MLSQWSMSEHEGVLRVASTTSPPWTQGGAAGESESFVTTLAAAGDRLVEVGRVGGIGRGEQIYAVRFIGDAGYVVTFRQVDPLYTLDLSDAAEPRVVGELKIPGYSAYLHPVGDGLLLGIGQDANSDGITSGVQASLFDVSDPAAPARLSHVGLGSGTYDRGRVRPSRIHLRRRERARRVPARGLGFDRGRLLRRRRRPRRPRRRADEDRAHRTRRRLQRLDPPLAGRRRSPLHGLGEAIAEHDPATLDQLALTRFTG